MESSFGDKAVPSPFAITDDYVGPHQELGKRDDHVW